MLSRSLVSGIGLSGLWHGGALALAVAAGIFQPGRGGVPGPVAEVSLMSAAAFGAMVSVAPEAAASPPAAPPPQLADSAIEDPASDTAGQALPRPASPLGTVGAADLAPAAIPNPAVADRIKAALPDPALSAPRGEAVQEPEPNVQGAADDAPERVVREKPAKPTPDAAPDAPSGTGQSAKPEQTGGAGGSSAASDESLLADWGGRLRQKVDRARRYPSGADGQTGKVTLRLSVAASGRVLGMSVLRSSGIAALDTAAVDAVRRAGRLPQAPNGLSAASYDFNLPVVFTR